MGLVHDELVRNFTIYLNALYHLNAKDQVEANDIINRIRKFIKNMRPELFVPPKCPHCGKDYGS